MRIVSVVFFSINMCETFYEMGVLAVLCIHSQDSTLDFNAL